MTMNKTLLNERGIGTMKKGGKTAKVSQDRGQNFRDKNGKLFLIRCYACEPERGRENYAMAVASGTCAWCGWTEKE